MGIQSSTVRPAKNGWRSCAMCSLLGTHDNVCLPLAEKHFAAAVSIAPAGAKHANNTKGMKKENGNKNTSQT